MRFLYSISIAALALCAMGVAAAADPTAAPTAAAAMPAENPALTKIARGEIDAWESGKIDRSKYNDQANKQITDDLVTRVSKQMAPLGPPTSFKYVGHAQQYGFDVSNYEAAFPQITLIESIALDAGGKISFIYFVPKR